MPQWRRQARILSAWAGILVFAVLAFGARIAHGANEAVVKAAYIFNFAKLVDWPGSAFDRAQAPLVIGVVGRDDVTDELLRTAGKVTANGRPLEIRRVAANAAALRACHMVFVPQSENPDTVLAMVQGHPVLVVGEAENFARRGGPLAFVKVNGTLKFEANPKAAARSGITVSSKLLRVAQTVVER